MPSQPPHSHLQRPEDVSHRARGAQDTGHAEARLPQATVDRALRFQVQLTPADVAALQRTVGNQATARLLTSRNAQSSEAPPTHAPAIKRTPVHAIQREFDPDEILSLDNYWVMGPSRLRSKLRAAILEVVPDEKMVDAYLDSNPQVAQILSGAVKDVRLGRVVYGARVAKQRQEMEDAIRAKAFRKTGKGGQVPPPTKDMALGYTNVPKWTKKQGKIIDKTNKDPATKLSDKELEHLRQNPKPQKGHELNDFTGSLTKESTWYKHWVDEGLVTKEEYDRGLIAWQVAFDKAATNLLVRGGKIHFDLTGFLPSEIEKLKSVEYWLPYKQETGRGNPSKTFESRYAGPTIGGETGSTLRSGLRITHWELAQVLYNRNMWEQTTFYINDPIDGFKQLSKPELEQMGIEYLGHDTDYISKVDRTEPG